MVRDVRHAPSNPSAANLYNDLYGTKKKTTVLAMDNRPSKTAKPHRFYCELFPEETEALDRARDVFHAKHGIQPRDSDIARDAIASFCKRHGVTYPDRRKLQEQRRRQQQTRGKRGER